MQEWISEIISAAFGFLGGATIGSLLTIKIINSSKTDKRHIEQSHINAGRDNIGGDKTDR